MQLYTAFAVSALFGLASCQLRPNVAVGASTPLDQKTKICNILDFGGKADGKTDNGLAIQKAFDTCVKGHPKTRIVIPEGNWLVKTGVKLSYAQSFAIEIRGRLIRDQSLATGTIIEIYKSSDVEIFGVNGGAIQGNGYLNRVAGKPANTRLLRFEQVNEATVRDLFLIDSPEFALTLNGCNNNDIHGLTIRAMSKGGTDGIDVAGDNIHVHHSTVTNRDECVCVKSPSSNILIDNIICNHSAGISLGSFHENTQVKNVEIHHIQSYQCYQFILIKLYKNANGYVDNVYAHDFTGYDNLYGINIDAYWEELGQTGGATGVALSNLRFHNFAGTVTSGAHRGAIHAIAPVPVAAKNIEFSNIQIWDPKAHKVAYSCSNVYGKGNCALPAGQRKPGQFLNQYFDTKPPAGFVMPQKPSWAFDGHSATEPIPIH